MVQEDFSYEPPRVEDLGTLEDIRGAANKGTRDNPASDMAGKTGTG
jgi:hypothetical protein